MATANPLPRPEFEALRGHGTSFGPPQAVPDEQALDLRALIGVVQRRKILLLTIVTLVTSLAAIFISQVTPRYRAEAQLVVESANRNFAALQSVAPGISNDYYTNETQAAILSSRELAGKVVDRLDLTHHPLFQRGAAKPPGAFKSTLHVVTAWLHDTLSSVLSIFRASDELPDLGVPFQPEADRDSEQREAAIDRILGGLTITPAERSRVISVQYSSTDSAFAATAANAVAEAYILEQVTRKEDVTKQASAWLDARVEELRARVIESKNRLENFRRESGIVALDTGGSVLQQQLAELNGELTRSRTAASEADARYRQVEQLIKSENGIETAAVVLDSPLIQRLREQEAQVVRKLAELKNQLRPGHPRFGLAENEIKELRENITVEATKIIRNLDNERDLARIRLANLQGEVARVQARLDQQNEAEGTMRALDSEVKANNQLYETMLSRLKETRIQDDSVQQADARLISRAVVPGRPYYPRKQLMIAAALAVSMVLALMVAFLVEFLDAGFRSVAQLEAASGVPTLATVPLLPHRLMAEKLPHEIAIEQPNSVFSEAIRSLRTGLVLSNVDYPPKTVLVTSSLPNEGKTTTALAIAASAARSGQRTVLVDCDLRKPSIGDAVRLPRSKGLTDFLTGQARLNDVLELDPKSGMHVITAGSPAHNTADLLGSMHMRGLNQALAEQFDLVIYDMPPLLAVSDALVMVRNVDKTILVVRWAKTRRETAISVLRQLIEAGADVAGIVLSQIDIRRHAQYDASHGGRYESVYRRYYTT